jgi:hypothetical protein
MPYKTPPLRSVMFEQAESELGGKRMPVQLREMARAWSEWFTNMARAVGFPVQSLTTTASLNFPSVAANGGTQDLTVTLNGVKAADSQVVVDLGLPTGLNAGLLFHAWVSADDTVTVRCTNATAGAIDPAAATFRIEARRY